MCGICGIALADATRRADLSVVEVMTAALKHRGPDDSGTWDGGHVALGMRRLSIQDLPGGHQPMSNEDGTIVVVFNGEIYNFQELRASLEARGHTFRTRSDTEVIVHAYEEYGDDAVERFNGMWAFALYDRNRDRLLLSRDRLGIKPLFYREHGGTLVFASELDALLQSGLVRGPLNPAAVDAYFSFLYVPAPDTILADVHKLCPGEKLVFERGQATTQRYWRVEYAIDQAWTLADAADAYRELIEDAVRLRRISDVPLGAFLSGGMDSSTVVGMLSRQSGTPIKTFTIGFDDAHADELRFARIAAGHFGTDHTEAVLTPDMVDLLPMIVSHFGEPFADSSAVPTWLVSHVARRDVTVALSGDGGDELFAGYTWAHRDRQVGTYRAVPAPLRHLVDLALALAPGSPGMAKLKRFSEDSFRAPRDSFRRRETCFGEDMRAVLYRPALAQAIAASAVDRFEEHAAAGPGAHDDWMLHQDTSMYLPDDILTKVDRMSMANGLETRVPLLDHRLVEFAATVPFAFKLRGGVSKRLAKHAVRDLLPPELLAQRKRGFAIPIHRWFREDLRDHFQDLVFAADARSPALLDSVRIRALFDAHTAGREHYGHHLWAITIFEHWLRYIERHTGVVNRVSCTDEFSRQ
ncbi:MAG: asparagine synthase (glutamine-hydrolyzing) [Nitrospiraceae bacterium]|nr:asparagine synthase (glutamine-hydrolyzing) [Nitrospiraceae bacterium]